MSKWHDWWKAPRFDSPEEYNAYFQGLRNGVLLSITIAVAILMVLLSLGWKP